MGAPGDRPHRQPREARRDLVDHGVQGQRMLGVGVAVLRHAHAFDVGASRPLCRPVRAAVVAHPLALGEEHRDAPLSRLRHALDQRPVDLLRLARAEDLAEVGRHLARLGEQQHARRVAVEPVDEHRPRPVLARERLQHAVDVPLRSRAALHREPVRLVEHDDVAVLVEGHRPDRPGVLGARGLARGRGYGRQPQRGHAHRLADFEAGRDFGALSVNPHLALADDLVEVRLRQVGKAATKPTVEAHPGLVLADLVDGGFRTNGPRRGGREIRLVAIAHGRGLTAGLRRAIGDACPFPTLGRPEALVLPLMLRLLVRRKAPGAGCSKCRS